MNIATLSTFPHMYDSVMNSSIMKRAQDKGLLDFHAFDLRDWTHDRHRTTDDYPYGGGNGLVMKCEPIFEAVADIVGEHFVESRIGRALEQHGRYGLSAEDEACAPKIVFLSPNGRQFSDGYASELAKEQDMLFICGHYEGIDERVYCLADETISLGDYVLTSGELASMVVIDAVVRKIPGVLGAQDGAQNESFVDGLLEYPQYTRPANFKGMEVPEVLVSGHHENIRKWQREQSLKKTLELRPDLIRAMVDGMDVLERGTACSGALRCGLSVEDLDFLKTCLD